jgi:hypothetical protein
MSASPTPEGEVPGGREATALAAIVHPSPLARLLASAERCQYEQSPIKRPVVLRWARAACIWGRRISRSRARPAPLGTPSRFKAGDWVRVRDAEEIRATLDGEDRLRGLRFMDTQWLYCGGTYQVARVVRRMLDDGRSMRSISGVVMLDGVTCDGPDGAPGCGRACALMFKDEWLEPGEPGTSSFDARVLPDRYVRVKSAPAVLRTLGRDGRLQGVSPSPQMLALAGQRFRVARRRELLLEGGDPKRIAKTWYVLDGVRCDGAVLGAAGPCHRLCGLLWHAAWLDFEQT